MEDSFYFFLKKALDFFHSEEGKYNPACDMTRHPIILHSTYLCYIGYVRTYQLPTRRTVQKNGIPFHLVGEQKQKT